MVLYSECRERPSLSYMQMHYPGFAAALLEGKKKIFPVIGTIKIEINY